MELHILSIFAFLSLALVASQAALPSRPMSSKSDLISLSLYWKSVLPNTPMPTHTKDMLSPGLAEDTTRALVVEEENKSLFFLEKDMVPGNQLTMDFTKSPNKATFLPRHIADSIPLSSKKLPEVFSQFSVKPDSSDAKIMNYTIEQCEIPEIKGENKKCVTSLESMIDFVNSKLGKKVQVFATEVDKEVSNPQKYTILPGIKLVSPHSVYCHKLKYKYAVHYCHTTNPSLTYVVHLVGDDGTKIKGATVCHPDTSDWPPNYFAFEWLNEKPGGSTICHILPEHHLIWDATKVLPQKSQTQ